VSAARRAADLYVELTRRFCGDQPDEEPDR
jgi:hypothetical protein